MTVLCTASSSYAQGNDNPVPTDPHLNRVNWAAAVQGSIISGCSGNGNFLIDSLGSGTNPYVDCAIPGGELLIDLGQSRTFDTIQLHLWDGDDRFYQYVISASDDGVNFTEIVNRSEGEYRGIQRLAFPQKQARYIKFVGDSGGTYSWFQPIDEIHVIGSVTSEPEVNQEVVVDAKTNGGGTYTVGVKVNLNAGVYKISHLAGAISQWADDSANGGKTWSGRTDVSVPHFNKSYQFGWVHTNLSTYATPVLADAAMQGKSFTLQLPAQSDVYFWLNDSGPSDNRGTHTIQITQLSGANDTLLERVRDSMTRSVLWQQNAVAYWSSWISDSNSSNPSCFGCHIQSQAVEGLNASKNKLPSLPVDQPFMSKAAEVFLKWQNPAGWVSPHHGGSYAVTQTSLWAWSLSSYKSPEYDSTVPGLLNALNWLKGQQTAAGGWNDDHGGGAIYGDGTPSSVLTTGNMQALVRALDQIGGDEFLPYTNLQIQDGLVSMDQNYGMVSDVLLDGASDVTGVRITVSDSFEAGGNFVFSEFEVFDQSATAIPIVETSANFSQGGYPISETIDGVKNDNSNGWAYGPNNVRVTPAVGFWKLNQSVSGVGRLRITQTYPGHQLKKYKIEFTSDPQPSINSVFESAPISAVGLLQPSGGTLGAALLTSLRSAAKMYINPVWNYARNTRTAAQTIIGIHQALPYLEAADADAAAPRMTEIANYLRSIQRSDGGWNDGSGVSRVYPSAMALRALLLLNPTDLDDVLLKGADYLLTTQQGDNAWVSPPIGTKLAITTWVEIALPTLFDVLSQDYLQNIVPDLTAYGLNGKVELLWTALSQAVSYNLFRKTAGLPWTEIAHGHQSDIASYTDTNVVNEATYYYKVQWNSEDGVASADSNEASATPYGMQCGSDSPPIITSPPVLGGVQGIPYQYQVEASDPDPGDILVYSLASSPTGMTIDAQSGLISWLPTPAQAGSHLVTIKVTDNIGHFAIQSYQVTVAAIYVNYPPQFSTTPNTDAIAGQLYSYPSHAIDPNGTDILTYELLIAPQGMTINSTTGKVKWTPPLDSIPDSTELVRIRVKDSGNLTDEQEFTVTIGANTAPTIISAPSLTAPRLIVYSYDVEAEDARNSVLTYSLQQKPTGMSINAQSGFITWVPTLAQVGEHQVHIRVSDPGGLIAEQIYTVTVPPNDPPYFVSTPKVIGAVDGTYSYDANAVDPEAQPLQFSVDSAPTGLTINSSSGVVSWIPTEDQQGAQPVVIKVTDDAGLSALQSYTVNVGPAGSNGGGNQPLGDIIVTINSPAYGSTISVKTELFATITSTTGPPDAWSAKLLRVGTDFSVPLGSAPGGLTNQSIGFIDPSFLPNDPYLVEIAVTKSGSTGYYTFPYDVYSNLKFGEFTFKVTDLSIPVAGIPIQIRRAYSSVDRANYEFGASWRLDLPGRVVDTADESLDQPFDGGTHVFVTRPDGKRVGFTFKPYPVGFLLPFWFPAFEPDPGVTDVLEVDQTVLFNSGGQFYELFGAFNPSKFYLTANPQKIRYTIDEIEGLLEARDSNFNTLTFTDGAITHSSGAGITLERDSQERLTKIIDLNGNAIEYSYSAEGDLLSVKNQANEITTYTYLAPHLLKTINLADGTLLLENVYDSEGRLVTQKDGEGNEIHIGINTGDLTETIQDKNGKITTFKFDINGNLIQKIDPNGKIWSYEYDSNYNLVVETDPLNHKITRTFDSKSRLLTETDARGYTKSFEYNDLGDVTKETDANGKSRISSYNSFGNLIAVTDEAGVTTSYTYDVNGAILSTNNSSFGSTIFERDSAGRATKITYSNGLVQSFTYTPNGELSSRMHTRTDAQGNVHTATSTITYDALGRAASVIDTTGNVRTYIRDAAGRVTQQTDLDGGTITTTYDANGNILSTTRPGSNNGEGVAGADEETEQFRYDGNGNVTQITDVLGNIYKYTYNDLNKLIQITLPDNSTTSVSYDEAGRLISHINPRGFLTLFEYDASGNRIKVIDPLGRVSTSVFDGVGQEVSRTNARGFTTTYEYDALGNITKTTNPDGTVTTSTYGPAGEILSKTDELGATQSFNYGLNGKVVSTIDALGNVTTYEHDEVGNLIKLIDAAGRVSVTDFDNGNRPIKHTLPGGMNETYGFGSGSNLTSYKNFRGENFAFTYDGQHRPKSMTLPDGSVRNYSFAGYDLLGSITDSSGSLIYSYTNLSQLGQVTEPGGITVQYGFDSNDNRTSVTTSHGQTIYNYDGANQLISVTDPAVGNFILSYDLNGNLASITHPSGMKENRIYDSRDRLLEVTTVNSDGSMLDAIQYGYNAVGDQVSVQYSDGAIIQYDYDAARRLIAETRVDSDATQSITNYTYDAVGNRTSVSKNGEQVDYIYDVNDRLIQAGSTTFQYDASGNLVSRNSPAENVQYTWDYEDYLTAINGPGVNVTHTYNPFKWRNATSINGVTTKYVLGVDDPENDNLAQILESVGSGDSVTARFTHVPHGVLAQNNVASGSVTSLFHDELGSTRSARSSDGALLSDFRYTGTGELISGDWTKSTMLFAGRPYEGNSGLYDMRARWYSPEQGRFISRDPSSINPVKLSDLNRYLYAGGNSVNWIDPTGLQVAVEYGQLVNNEGKVAAALRCLGLAITEEFIEEGLYILFFSDGGIYVGETDDMIRRFKQHVGGEATKWKAEIKKVVMVAFPAKPSVRKQYEQYLIDKFGGLFKNNPASKLKNIINQHVPGIGKPFNGCP